MTLAPVFLGSLGRRRMASLFSLLAIILGVALGMAVQAIHEAALNEFGRGVRTLAGEADLRLVGPASGFDETLFEQILRHPDIAQATPIVEIDAKLVGHEPLLKVLGVDIFTLARVAPRLLPQSHERTERFATLAEDSIFLSAAAQQAYGVQMGDPLPVQAGSRTLTLRVAGDLPGVGDGQPFGPGGLGGHHPLGQCGVDAVALHQAGALHVGRCIHDEDAMEPGVGATPAWGSQELKGQTAAFTPKPQKAMQYMSSSMDLLSPPVTEASRTPPKVKLMVVP